jgi:hypothetical protein
LDKLNLVWNAAGGGGGASFRIPSYTSMGDHGGEQQGSRETTIREFHVVLYMYIYIYECQWNSYNTETNE